MSEDQNKGVCKKDLFSNGPTPTHQTSLLSILNHSTSQSTPLLDLQPSTRVLPLRTYLPDWKSVTQFGQKLHKCHMLAHHYRIV